MASMLRYMCAALDSDCIETVQNNSAQVRLADVRYRGVAICSFILSGTMSTAMVVAMVVSHKGRHYHTS